MDATGERSDIKTIYSVHEAATEGKMSIIKVVSAGGKNIADARAARLGARGDADSDAACCAGNMSAYTHLQVSIS